MSEFYKNIFDAYLPLCEKYWLVDGFMQVAKKGEYFEPVDFTEENFCIIGGRPCYDDILEAFEELELNVDKEGFYSFKALLSFSPEQWGEFLEVRAYYIVDHIEFKYESDNGTI